MLRRIAKRVRMASEALTYRCRGITKRHPAAYQAERRTGGLAVFRDAWWHSFQLESRASIRRSLSLLDWGLVQSEKPLFAALLPECARVLVIRLGHLGDLLHLMPTIREMKRQRPDLRMELVTGPWNEDLAGVFPEWDVIHTYTPDVFQFHRGNRQNVRNIEEEQVWITSLRGERVDLVFCPSKPQMADLPLIVGLQPAAYVGCDWDIPALDSWVNGSTRRFDSRRYEADAIADYLPVMGLSRPDVQLFYPVDNASRRRIAELLAAEGIGEQPFVAMFPGSGWPGKCWPVDRFIAVARHLTEKGGAVILGGSGSERPLCEAIATALEPRAINLAGRLSIREAAALIEASRLLIGNDSAPIHFAAALQVPTVSLWGPTFPEKWAPKGEMHTVLRAVESCPCLYWHPSAVCERDGACMKAITVEQVIRAVEERLGLGTGN